MRRPIVFVVLAGLAAMLASVVVYSALKTREAEVANARAKNVEIVVAAYDLPLGTKIEPGELKTARWSADAMPEGAMRDPKDAIGAYVKSAFVANEPIVQNKLFAGQKTAGVMPLLIPFGMRAVSVPVDEVSDIAGFVLPHTRVDILVAVSGGDGGANKPFSKVVLQNVEVLAVAQEVEMQKDEPQLVKVVTLLVSPQEAERLALATREGTLHLAMRNYNDNKIVLTQGSDVTQMLHAYSLTPDAPVITPQAPAPKEQADAPVRPRTRPFEVEIYRNGKSSESVSFINAAFNDAPKSKHSHDFERADEQDAADNGAAPAGPDVAAAPAPDGSVDRPDASAPGAAPAPAPGAAGASAAPMTNPANESSFSAPVPAYAPRPKTIDVP